MPTIEEEIVNKVMLLYETDKIEFVDKAIARGIEEYKKKVKETIEKLSKRWLVKGEVCHPTPNDGFDDLKEELGLE